VCCLCQCKNSCFPPLYYLPATISAKAILYDKGARYKVVELDKESDGKAIRAEMGTMLGRTSVPAIWINGVFIGGCNDGPTSEYNGINNLNTQNKLDGMLKLSGAI
jgi:glutaredoxin 3